MGASAGKVCERRQQVSSNKPQAKDAVAKNDTKDAVAKNDTKAGNLVAEPISLPTKSWRALLEEQPDAKPYAPSQAPPPRQFTAKARPLSTGSAVKDDAEWMQCLSKKFEGAANTPSKFSFSGSKFGMDGKGKGKGKSNGKGFPGSMPTAGAFFGGRGESATEGPAAGAGHGMNTEAYLTLLRDGAAKKVSNIQTARRTQNKNLHQWLSADKDSSQANEMPMTISNLANKWSSMVERAPDAEVERTTQDDIQIEKLLVDKDLSDPAYYSDPELTCINIPKVRPDQPRPVHTYVMKTNASIHPLGCRPKLATSSIRTYVMQDLSFMLDKTVAMLLLRLQRLMDQEREAFVLSSAISELQAQRLQQRRFITGIKEVARRINKSQIQCLMVAPDIEEQAKSGGLDSQMRELLELAYKNSVPVIFALSRARMGKALGKSMHISALGVLDSRGATNLMEESLRLAREGREGWLARLGT